MASQSKTIQQIGLGTFEQVPEITSAPDYTEYWRTYAREYLPQMGHLPRGGELSDYDHMTQFVGHIATSVIGQNDLAGLIEFKPGLWYSEREHYGRPIKNWDNWFGHFNDSVGAQTDLKAAASILVQENAGLTEGWLSEFSSALRPEMMSLSETLDYYPTAQQKNSGELLLAAELMHKAGWLATDYAERLSLFREASTIYDQFTKGPVDRLSIKANAYSHDLDFYQVHRTYRQYMADGDKFARRQSQYSLAAMRQLVAESAYEVARMCHIYESCKGGQHYIKGSILEQFVPLLLRDTIISEIEQNDGQDDDFFAVRQAFSHEDMSPSVNYLHPGFDLVIQRFADDETVNATTPLQLKFEGRDFGGRPNNRPKLKYLPGITVIRASRMSYKDVQAAAEALQTKYSTGRREDVVKEIDRVQDFREYLEAEIDSDL